MLNNATIKIALFFMLTIQITLYIISLDITHAKWFSSLVLVINLLSLSIFLLRRESIKGIRNQYIRILPIFLTGYIIVYFQLHLDFILGNFSISHDRFWVNLSIVPQSLSISSIGFVSFLLGYTLNRDKKRYDTILNKFTNYRSPLLGYKILLAFFLTSTILTINPKYLFGGYGIYEIGVVARYSMILFELSFTAMLVQLIINKTTTNYTNISLFSFMLSIGKASWVFLFTYLSVVIISGDRGPVIFITVALASSFFLLSSKKISVAQLGVSVVIAAIIISSLVVIRNNEESNESFLEKITTAIIEDRKAYASLEETNSIVNSTLELATSIRTLHNAVNSIENGGRFFYGQFQLLQLASIFPLGQVLAKEIFNLDDNELTSAKYVSSIIGRKNGSEGTSSNADLYLDFHIFGVLLGMLLFGYYVRHLEKNVFSGKNTSLVVLISYIIFCEYAIYLPRSTLLFNFRNIIWVLIIMFIIRSISKKLTKTPSRPQR